MPSEDLPPLAPFPELAPAPSAEGGNAVAEPSLLSAAQRRELAFAADLLSGRTAPPPADEIPAPNAADDFLLGGSTDEDLRTDGFSFVSVPPAEEPVESVEFLALPGDTANTVAVPPAAFNLQSIAASLATPAAEPPVAVPVPRVFPDEWETPSLPAFPSLVPLPGTGPLQNPPKPATGPVFPPPAGSEPPAETKPAVLLTPAAPAGPTDGFFVTLPEAAPPDSPAFFPPLRPAESPPEYQAPVPFPVSSEAQVSPQEDPVAADRALWPVLCGALLIVAGVFLACRLGPLWEGSVRELNAGNMVQAGHLRGELGLTGAGALACALLGLGAITLRRWAPPLIHAAGWTVLLTVLGEMAVATGAMFYYSPGPAEAGSGVALFALAGIAGVAFPLVLIAVFQRDGVGRLCERVDSRSRWTDTRSIPSLMVFVAGFTLAVIAAAMAVSGSAFPAFGNLALENHSIVAWGGIAVAGAAAGGLAALGLKSGWWVLSGIALMLTAAMGITCRYVSWEEIFHLPAGAPPSLVAAILGASTLLPLLLIVFITRRAHATESEETY